MMKIRTDITFEMVAACPKRAMNPEHYRDDHTCNCQHREEIDARLKELNIERKRLRAEHRKIVKQIDQLKRSR